MRDLERISLQGSRLSSCMQSCHQNLIETMKRARAPTCGDDGGAAARAAARATVARAVVLRVPRARSRAEAAQSPWAPGTWSPRGRGRRVCCADAQSCRGTNVTRGCGRARDARAAVPFFASMMSREYFYCVRHVDTQGMRPIMCTGCTCSTLNLLQRVEFSAASCCGNAQFSWHQSAPLRRGGSRRGTTWLRRARAPPMRRGSKGWSGLESGLESGLTLNSLRLQRVDFSHFLVNTPYNTCHQIAHFACTPRAPP